MIHTDGNPTIASRISAARAASLKTEETKNLAVELAATTGFCQGFLGKATDNFQAMLLDFPEDYRPEMQQAYRREYAEGQLFVEIPIAEIHPDNPFN